MKTNLKEINSYTRQLDITIAWDLIKDEFMAEFKKAQLNYSMPGFRKGKVPPPIVKKNLGPSIEANFAEHSINNYYRKALKELHLSPINQASIDNLNFKEGIDLSFSARFEVNPVVNLPQYQKKFKIKAIKYIPEDIDVEQALENYREQNATIKTIESGADTGHFIRGKFQQLDEKGLPVVGSILENQYIRLGFGIFKDDAEKVFLGSKEGDQINVTVKNNDKPITYRVEVERVEEQILADLDDELAKSVNEKFNTLQDLKNQILKDLETSLNKDHNDLIQKEIINYFINNSNIDAPDSMVDLYLEQIKDDLRQRKQKFEDKDIIENYKSHAEWNIKWYLIKDKIIEIESIKVLDKEIEDKINTVISNNKSNEEEIKKYFKDAKNRQNLYGEILNEKLFSYLKEFSKIKVIEKSTEELRKKQAAQ